MYQYKEARPEGGVQRYVLSLDNHVSVMEVLAAFCREKGILCATFPAWTENPICTCT